MAADALHAPQRHHHGPTVAARQLLEPMGEHGRTAIWAYRAAVCDAVERRGRHAHPAHDQGPSQIGLRIATAPELLLIWRIDTGWYFLDSSGGTPLLAPTRYYAAADPLERLLPPASDVARWIVELADGLRPGTTEPPPPLTPRLARDLGSRLAALGPDRVPPARWFDAEPEP